MNTSIDKDVDKLNEFLKNEISAVETYSQCIEKGADWTIAPHLSEIQQSHAERARLLRERIVSLGGEPAEGSGMWGGITKLIQGGANAFGEKAALSALEEGEDKGLADYRDESDELSPASQQFVVGTLLPAQQRSHDAMRSIKRAS